MGGPWTYCVETLKICIITSWMTQRQSHDSIILEPAVHGVVGARGEGDGLTNMITFISRSQLALSKRCVTLRHLLGEASTGGAPPSEFYQTPGVVRSKRSNNLEDLRRVQKGHRKSRINTMMVYICNRILGPSRRVPDFLVPFRILVIESYCTVCEPFSRLFATYK